jgi:hypothetical protein
MWIARRQPATGQSVAGKTAPAGVGIPPDKRLALAAAAEAPDRELSWHSNR